MVQWKLNPKNKYMAQRCGLDGHEFDSKAERDYFSQLKLLESAGEIEILELQPKVYMTDSRILYKPDFLILEKKLNEKVYIDVKGMETPVFRLKMRLWKEYGAGTLRLVKKDRFGFHDYKDIYTRRK